jgi:hypothetical protein
LHIVVISGRGGYGMISAETDKQIITQLNINMYLDYIVYILYSKKRWFTPITISVISKNIYHPEIQLIK